MKKKTMLLIILILATSASAQATTFDVAADFSATNNPNGVWNYGWSSTLMSAFNLYLNHGKFDPIIPVDVWAGSNHPYSPNVSHNGTGSPIHHPTITWQPGQFSLHPGDSGEYSYARWTAPYAGTFDIAAMFTGIDHYFGTTTDVHVLHNGISLFDGSIDGYGDTSSFSTTALNVGMGDRIDFTVGYGSNQTHTCDTTALSATIVLIPEPAAVEMEWVYINDPGVSGHEGFNGYMSKYETTNAQYCQFLNNALASGDITVSSNIVYGANGSNGGSDFVGEVYFETYATSPDSQITYSDGVFSVRTRDGYDMSNHPVVEVSWYGATAFCNYYVYRLPTEWEWQSVADYDGSYTYGCGTSIDHSKANYDWDNPLNLSSYPYTSPAGHYPAYGYGMNDMAGNVWEWTDSIRSGSSYHVIRGGGWIGDHIDCTVSDRDFTYPQDTFGILGFRVVRTGEPDAGLVAYWSFDDAGDPGHDDSGNENNGTVYGAESIDGVCGGALSFDGDDYVQVADDDSLDISDKISISAWINPSSTSSIRMIVSKYKDYAGMSYLLELRYEKLHFMLRDVRSFFGIQTFSTGIWYHVAATYDGSHMRIYINGELDNEQAASGTIPITTQELNIGRQADNNYWSFEGLIDEVRIYDRALSECEIKELATPCEPAEPEWSFVHLTDTHIGCPIVLDPKEGDLQFDLLGIKGLIALASTIHKINHSDPKPDFILNTGDIVDYAWLFNIDAWWNYIRYLLALKSLDPDIEVYAVPGNHDRYVYRCEALPDCLDDFPHSLYYPLDLSLYETFITQPDNTVDLVPPYNYSFKNKELTFIGLDSGAEGEGLEDLMNDLADPSKINPDVQKIIFMHHPVVDLDGRNITNEEDFIRYCEDNNVQLVLSGHTHEANILNADGNPVPVNSTFYPQFIQTPSTSGAWWGVIPNDLPGYRFINVKGGKTYAQEYTQTEGIAMILALLFSPANLHVYDSLGRHVGILDSNETERGIPDSFYFSHYAVPTEDGNENIPEIIMVFDPCDDYLYEVVGTEAGTYRLEISSTEDGNDTVFDANDIPTLPGSIHTYMIDWDALSQGQNGVTITVDVDGDGDPEKTIISDNVLTSDEFDTPPIASAGGPYVAKATSWLGASVDLDGTESSDPDGDEITYEWDLDLSVDSDGDGDPNNDVDAIGPTHEAFFYIGQTKIALVVVDEYGVRSEPDTTTVTVSVIEVGIDIKPGSLSNAINLGSHGVIPVAFLSDSGFDASTIDPATVTLRGEDFTDGLVKLRGKKDAPVPMSNLEDVDEDGDLDLVVHLVTEQLAEYELEAMCELGALTYEGYVVSGSDTIRIVPE